MATAPKPAKSAKKPPAQKKAAPPPEPKKRGRPSSFDQDAADELIERIADGESLRSICRDESMPRRATVFRWLAADPAFQDQYARACEVRVEEMFDQMLEIADTPQIGYTSVSKATGTEITEADMIAHRRLQVEARKWMLGKMAPKKYGEKIDLNHGGQEGNPVEVKTKVVVVPMKQVAENILRKLEGEEDGRG